MKMLRAVMLATVVFVCACGDDDGGGSADAAVDATPPAPDAAPAATLFEQLVARGTWIRDYRLRDMTGPLVACDGCRDVLLMRFEADEECGCARGTFTYYWDVVDAVDPMGRVDGDEFCHHLIRMSETSVEGIDPFVRSAVSLEILESTCGAPVGAQGFFLFDAQTADAAGQPSMVGLFEPGGASPFAHPPGFPTDPAQLQEAAMPIVPCDDEDHATGRAYCLPTCDWPGADPGRTECAFPPYVQPPYYNVGCQDTPYPTTAPDPLTVSGDVGSGVTGELLAGATVEARLVSDDTLLDSATTAANGSFTVSYATGGVALDTYLRVTAAGSVGLSVFSAAPAAGDTVSGPRLLTPARLDELAAQAGVTRAPGTGVLVIGIADCGGVRVPGAVVTVEGVPSAEIFYADDAAFVVDPSLTATSTRGAALVFNLPPGLVDANIMLGQTLYRSRPARVIADEMSFHDREP